MAKSTARRKSRETVLQALFMLEINPDSEIKNIREFTESYKESQGLDLEYAEIIFSGVKNTKEELDQKISESSENWKFERIPNIEKNILRISCWELLYNKEIETAVVISEAVEISSKFATPDSIPFINGILDKVSSDK
jgi:N utilization substance protein B